MYDQASELRELVRRGLPLAPVTRRLSPRILTVIGGRRGVGTTSIAVNLAHCLVRLRRRTVLVDADPARTADALARSTERDALAQTLQGRSARQMLRAGPGGLRLLDAAWAVAVAAGPPAEAPARRIGQLRELGGEADFVVVDAGNEVAPWARPLWDAADAALVVTTPDLASVMQAYASIKLLAADRTSGPARSAPLHVLVNRARRSVARQVHRRIAAACSRFLEIEVAGWGFVADDPQVAGRADEPFPLGAPRSKAARHVGRLAKTVVRRMNRVAVTK